MTMGQRCCIRTRAGESVGIQCGGQPNQQVVVAEDAPSALACVQFGQNVIREADADCGPRAGLWLARPQLRRRVIDHLAGDSQRVAVSQHGIVALLPEMGQVEIVDDLGDQLVEVLDQCDARVRIAGHTQRFQHQLTELVRGGDRGGVEPGQRVAQSLLVGRRAR